MFDTFQVHQFVKKFPFTFQATRFEIWQQGQMVKNGKTLNYIVADIRQIGDQDEIVSLNISDTSLLDEIGSINTFDRVFTLQDRIILVTIPEPTDGDNVGIMSLRTTAGVTRPGKRFNCNEPFCCSLFLIDKRIVKVTFSFSNPEKLIEFYSDNNGVQESSPIQQINFLAEQIIEDIKNEKLIAGRQNMIALYSKIKSNPSLLGQTNSPGKLGKAFVLMLNNSISSDDDIIESLACIAYLLVSKAILQNPSPNNYLDRLLIMEFSREQFNYSVQSACDFSEEGSISFFSTVGQIGGTEARDAIFKMEIADLYTNPILYQQVDIFKRKKEEFDYMLAENFFYNKTLPTLIEEGKANHEKAYKYFQNKIIVNQDIDV